ncbi:MAG: YjbH domain-containing protein [Bacteroidaceae bacterium]|nr:YjbH domain-containing protein [Bacteroidaceae bacterium]
MNGTLKKAILSLIVIISAGSHCVSAQNVDVFVGADLNYRRLFFNDQLYDLLIYVNPGVKADLGGNWQIAAQALIPVVNQYGDFYNRVRPGVCTVSKEILLQSGALKFSAGLFSAGRYGIDARWLYPVNEWFAVESQLGFTGYHTLEQKWRFSRMDRLTGNVRARFFIKKASSEIRISAGRYIYEDYGGQAEFYSHFNNTSVGLFAQYSNKAGCSAGAKIVFMIPFQKGLKAGKFTFRPASNFRLTYDVMADNHGLKNYSIDPEENERTGSFRTLTFPGSIK